MRVSIWLYLRITIADLRLRSSLSGDLRGLDADRAVELRVSFSDPLSALFSLVC